MKSLISRIYVYAGIGVDKVDLEISSLSKDAVIRFRGDERTCRRGVKQVLDSFRTAPGIYTHHTVAGADGKIHSCFINGDKSRKDIRTEIACKKLRLLLESKYSKGSPKSPGFEWKRLGGIVCSGWKDLAKFIAPDADTFEWKWNRPKAEAMGIDTAAMDKLFEEDFGSGAGTVLSQLTIAGGKG